MVRSLIIFATVAAFFAFVGVRVDAQIQRSATQTQGKVYWTQGAEDDVEKVGEFFVVQYKNAGTGGIDWRVFGSGAQGGDGDGQLWLFDSPNRAIVQFSKKSTAVAFLMSGDHNDGYAQFIVDEKAVGTFDLYKFGKKTLIVSGLPNDYHTIQVVHLEKANAKAEGDHVAIFGGAALSGVASENRLEKEDVLKAISDNDMPSFDGGWHEFRSGKGRWLIRTSDAGILALYDSPAEVGKAAGKLDKEKLLLNYKNTYQDSTRYRSKSDARDIGKLECKILGKSLICRAIKGKMNQGLEFMLERES